MSQSVADYVMCVRSQSAKLSKDSGNKLSAEVGHAGTHLGVAREVRDQLWQTYEASDANVLAIIQACNHLLGDATQTRVVDISGNWTSTFENGGEQPFTMTLVQSGDKVTMPFGSHGQAAGTMKERTLSGNWNEGTLKGAFLVVFSDDLQTFSGQWGYDGEPLKYWWKGSRPQ